MQFLRSAEYDHRLKIKNVGVADQKQVLSHAWCDKTTSPVFVLINLCNDRFVMLTNKWDLINKVSKDAKIRNRYNQVPHLTQDTNGKVTNSQ